MTGRPEPAQKIEREGPPPAGLGAPRRVHGRRKGRKLSPTQEDLLARMLPGLRLDLGASAPDDLRTLFSAPVKEVWLEIGFGAGEHLVWQASTHPEIGIVGAEPFINGVAAALALIRQHGLEGRVRLHDDDATPLLGWLPENSLARVFLLFPDPWPKKRHRQRRFLSQETLDAIVRLLRPGGEFRFASDIADYAEFARDIGEAHPGLRLDAHFTSRNRDAMPGWPETRYERKARQAGRDSDFLLFRRV